MTVTQDRNAPELRITSPESGTKTIDQTIILSGTSEPGATVEAVNAANGWDQDVGVGPSGTFEFPPVRLDMGKNRITVRSTDTASMVQEATVVVERQDGRPIIALDAPSRVARSALPKPIRIAVQVKDVNGDRVENATVSYTLGGSDRTSDDFLDKTDANGRSNWDPMLAAGASDADVTVTVEVIAPNRQRAQSVKTIDIY